MDTTGLSGPVDELLDTPSGGGLGLPEHQPYLVEAHVEHQIGAKSLGEGKDTPHDGPGVGAFREEVPHHHQESWCVLLDRELPGSILLLQDLIEGRALIDRLPAVGLLTGISRAEDLLDPFFSRLRTSRDTRFDCHALARREAAAARPPRWARIWQTS